MRAIAPWLALVFAACQERAVATPEVRDAGAAPVAQSAAPPTLSDAAEGDGGPGEDAAPATADAASDASRDAGSRDSRLKACCSRFGAYATGYVADRGPNLSHIEAKCIALWKSGATLAEAQPELERLVQKERRPLDPSCKGP